MVVVVDIWDDIDNNSGNGNINHVKSPDNGIYENGFINRFCTMTQFSLKFKLGILMLENTEI